MSQIKFPIHMVEDAQGPCGIMDKAGKAIAWFSDVHVPTKGYVWHPESKHTTRSTGETTCYAERNRTIEAIFDLLLKFRETKWLSDELPKETEDAPNP